MNEFVRGLNPYMSGRYFWSIKDMNNKKIEMCRTLSGVEEKMSLKYINKDEVMLNKQLKVIEKYLEDAYSGAKMMNDVDAMCRISRAIGALKADPTIEIFTEEFKESYYN